MRMITFKSLLDDTLRTSGLVPSVASAEDVETMAGMLGDALKSAWEWGKDWPEWCLIEELPAITEWAVTVAYPAGSVVWYGPESRFYRAMTDAAAGLIPPEHPTVWELTAAPATRDMATVFGVYAVDPRENKRALKLDWVITSEGLLIPRLSANATVWVHYRQSVPRFTGIPWSAVTTYAKGDLVYREATGECYLALTASTNVTPEGHPAVWSLRPVPASVADYVRDTAAARWVRVRGQFEYAGRLAADASMALVLAYDKARGYGRRI